MVIIKGEGKLGDGGKARRCECYAETTDPERKELWGKIFCEGKVPICPFLHNGTLLGQPAQFFLVDFSRVSHAQEENLISELAEKFALTPEEVRGDIANHGVPVRVEDIALSLCAMHKWREVKAE